MSAGAFSQAIFNGAVTYLQAHPDIEPGFALSDADLDTFFAELSQWDPDVTREDFGLAERYVRYHLEREIALQHWGEAGQFRQSQRYDRQLERAMDVLEGVETPDQLFEAVERAASDAT